MKLLYQVELGGHTVEEICGRFDEWAAAPAGSRDFALELVNGTTLHRPEIEAAIKGSLQGWELGRLAAVDSQLLRLAVFELLFRPDIPANVTMDEAIELAREYSSTDGARFVNGVLDAIARKHATNKLTPSN